MRDMMSVRYHPSDESFTIKLGGTDETVRVTKENNYAVWLALFIACRELADKSLQIRGALQP